MFSKNRAILHQGVIAALSIALFCIALFVHAQEPAVEQQAPAQAAQPSGPQTEVAKEKPVARGMLSERLQDRFINLTSNITTRLQASIDRFHNIVGRIDSRIAKLKGQGINTSTAEVKLEAAKNTLRLAEERLALVTDVPTVMRGKSPKAGFITLRTHILETREFLKQTHTNLKETVAALKEAVAQGPNTSGVSPAVSESEQAQQANPTPAQP